MKTIAYRTVDHPNSAVAASLPPDYVTEWTLYDPSTNALDPAEGWKFLSEDEFHAMKAEVNVEHKIHEFQRKQDEERHRKHLEQLVAAEARAAAEQAEKQAESAKHAAEFEEFLAWKKR